MPLKIPDIPFKKKKATGDTLPSDMDPLDAAILYFEEAREDLYPSIPILQASKRKPMNWGVPEQQDYLDIAIRALQHEKEAMRIRTLTVDDLRNMIGEPVWVVIFDDQSDFRRGGWHLVIEYENKANGETSIRLFKATSHYVQFLYEDELGISFSAMDRMPAN